LKIIIILLLTLNLFADQGNFEFKSNFGITTEGNLLAKFKDAKIALKAWLDDMANLYKGEVGIEFYDKPELLYEDFKKNKIDMAVVSLSFFFENRASIEKNSTHIWSLSIDNKKFNRYYLIGNKKQHLKGFSNLKRKTMAIKKGDETAAIWLDKNSYEKNKVSSDKLLKIIKYEDKERTVLLNVFFGKTDYAIVTKDAWDVMLEFNPTLKKRIEILKESDNIFLPFIGFFSKNAHKKSVEVFFKVSSNLEELNGGKRIIKMLNFNSIFKVDDKMLLKLDNYHNDYFRLKKKYR
jgi:hypothetical protein